MEYVMMICAMRAMEIRWKAFIVLLTIVFGFFESKAQSSTHGTFYQLTPLGTVSMKAAVPDFFPLIKNLTVEKEAPAHTPAQTASDIRNHASYLRSLPDLPVDRVKTITDQPTSGIGFQANAMDGIPNDNSLALGRWGDLVSVTNSKIAVYSTTGQVRGIKSLDVFAFPFLNSSIKFDPRVIYDPTYDRFILAFLSGRTPSTSQLVLAFSQTPDPMENWNLYAFPGQTLPNTLLDYPQIGISSTELFVSAQVVDSAGLNTYGSGVMQVTLANGYQGNTLDMQIFQSNYTGLLPVSAGEGNYGPDFYFISSIALPTMPSQSILLHHITGTIAAGGQLTLPVTLQAPGSYTLPSLVNQPNTSIQLNTNDCRILGAYYLFDHIQFVLNTTRNATSAVYYGSIHLDASFLGDSEIDTRLLWSDSAGVAYPSVAYGGCYNPSNGRPSSVVGVNYSSHSLNPGSGAFYVDEYLGVSSLEKGKAGYTYIGSNISNPWRWGDYTATVPNPNTPGEVWVAGSFGTGPSTHQSSTWINQWFSPCWAPVGNLSADIAKPELSIFPNPAPQWVEVQFSAPQSGNYELTLWDVEGKRIKTLVSDHLSKGSVLFQFSVAPLPQGLYWLRITQGENLVHQEKLVVAR